MAAKLKEYKARRSNLIGRLESIYEVAMAAETEPSMRALFNRQFSRADEITKKLNSIHEEIVASLASQGQEVDEEEVIRENFEKWFSEMERNYVTWFPPKIETENISAASGSVLQGNVCKVKLPKLVLKMFDGNYSEWQTFKCFFDSTVHNHSELSTMEKYQYLLSCLKGEPLNLISSLELSEANYLIAYETITARYSDTRKLASHYYRNIQNLAAVKFESASQLRDLVDKYRENRSALKALNLPNMEDFLWFNDLLQKIDLKSRREFESHIRSKNPKGIPTFDDLIQFLESHCQVLDSVTGVALSLSPSNQKPCGKSHNNLNSVLTNKSRSAFVVNSSSAGKNEQKRNCVLCKENHDMTNCKRFLSKSPKERFATVKEYGLCIRCLKGSHLIRNCNTSSFCSTCGSRHNSLLHFSLSDQAVDNPSRSDSSRSRLVTKETSEVSENVNEATSLTSSVSGRSILLTTAIVEIQDIQGNYHKIRALLDNCSEGSFMSRSCLNKLGLRYIPSKLTIRGIDSESAGVTSPGHLRCNIRAVNKSATERPVTMHVLPQISRPTPSTLISRHDNWKHFEGLSLADPSYFVPGNIQILLGGDVYGSCLLPGLVQGTSSEEPSAFNSIFGWVISGPTGGKNSSTSMTTCFTRVFDSESNLDNSLKRLWEIEDLVDEIPKSPDELACEEKYLSSVSRDESGRYSVKLPFKQSEPVEFVGSREIALKRFLVLEKRLVRNSDLRDDYSKAMSELLESGHMSPVLRSIPESHGYFIPHHCIVKRDSPTTKTRIVFDASTKDQHGMSLNDTLFSGPTLLRDLVSVLLNFRLHKIVFTSDIRQMFRQINVHNDHRKYQLVLWRSSPEESIKEFSLNTVVFGVTCSPYLAIRTLHQLAQDEGHNYPLAVKIVENDVYCDDIVSGADSVESALEMQKQLIELLKLGQFELRKWACNDSELLRHLDPSCRLDSLEFDSEQINVPIKVLGLRWLPEEDNFAFNVHASNRPCTKRNVLSDLARIYDPCGFLSPIVFFAKRLIQTLWCLGLHWDEVAPENIVRQWKEYCFQLSLISELRICRYGFSKPLASYELHGFSDASESGYAAVVYVRAISETGVKTCLLISKTKLAPIKRRPLPQLELCGAYLLAKVIRFVKTTYSNHLEFSSIVAWCDSTITLCWIKSQPVRLKTFVSNRVAYIQDHVPASCWRFVRSADNAADLASRGCLPSSLLGNSLWFEGPKWLRRRENYLAHSEIVPSSAELEIINEAERKLVFVTDVVEENSPFLELLANTSNLTKLQNTVVYVRRFVDKLRKRKCQMGHVVRIEREAAMLLLVKVVQQSAFRDEIAQLQSKQLLRKSLQKLSCFLDEDNIMRVGGRLSEADLQFNVRHPLLLPKESQLTTLIIRHVHEKYLHCGHKTTQYLLSQNYWIISASRAVRSVLAKCMVCFRSQPTGIIPQMGNLPSSRVQQSKAFTCTGVDFGGPFIITLNKSRGAKTTKAYLCLFVCAATKAVHLEIVSDLSTEAFLAALRRFIGRRGRCSKLFSDRGTNFVGAERELGKLFRQAASVEAIEWSFNPPSAPHFGGLFEAGIKSAKTLFRRVVGSQILTFEELTTVMVQIEAVLNSRPLCGLSSDPSDLGVLTPGHFLTLAPLTCLPDTNWENLPDNRLSRWQLLQKMQQSFWRRWHSEYLHTLQQRTKWFKGATNLRVGQLVLVKGENSVPLDWPLARVETVHPGQDGVVRVVTVRTSKGIYQRPVVKLCPLPTN